MRNAGFHRQVQGLSLIELMVAMTIGLFLLLGLIQVLDASRSSYNVATGVARTQENARFAIDSMQRDLRMAGHMGCVNDQAHMAPIMPAASDASREGLNLWFLNTTDRTNRSFNALSGNQMPLRFDMGIQGFEATGTAPGNQVTMPSGTPPTGTADKWSPALPAPIAALNPVVGSDIVVIRYLSGDGVPAKLTAPSGTTYTITPEAYGKTVVTGGPSGMFGLADCKQVSIFGSTAINTGTGVVTVDTTAGLNKSGMFSESEWNYEDALQPPMLYRAEVVVYYIGRGAGDGTNRPPSLFRARAVANATGGVTFTPEELVEGIESLQMLYGVDAHLPDQLPRGSIERMYVASTVSDQNNPNNAAADRWRRVGSVQIGMLMRSAERSSAEQSTEAPRVLGVKHLRGAGDAVKDGYFRSGYETTVALRNRLFGS